MDEKDTLAGASKASSFTMRMALNVMIIFAVASMLFRALKLDEIANTAIYIGAVIVVLSPIIVSVILTGYYLSKKSRAGSALSISVLIVLTASALISYFLR